MAEKHGVYVYPHDCTDFANSGLVGDIKPIEGVFTEEKNGISEVVIRIPYDELGRWKSFKAGNIVKCEVPVRMPPVIANDEYANTVDTYQ